ncbi:MAG: TIGR03936 family radical SAM-associated protein [Syntrophomonadaceae bacterium]|jgi:radical SAM-linked protein|nr:TIGR03936 family radical SAM-associated protein [Syntrophomonadaceae bacterium]
MRLRSEFYIGPALKFLSALDMMHLMERSLRRADIPYALSEGFNPHIKLSMGTVLPVGLWGKKEYMDLELRTAMEADVFTDKVNAVLPAGMFINKSVVLADFHPALMKIINAASYGFIWTSSGDYFANLAVELMKRPTLIVKSRGKKKHLDKDLKKGIYKIESKVYDNVEYIKTLVAVGDPINIRYDEILDLFFKHGASAEALINVYRSGNYILKNGELLSPMP